MIRAIEDKLNKPRTDLTQSVETINKHLGNGLRGFILIAWGEDSDAQMVAYNKGTLPIAFLPEYAEQSISDVIGAGYAEEESEAVE